MKTKTKSLLAWFVVFTVALSNLPILAAVNYVTAVRNVSSNASRMLLGKRIKDMSLKVRIMTE